MHPRIPDLLAYYLSDEFVQDYPNFVRRDPSAAAMQRQLIITQLETNAAALGVTLMPEDYRVHAAFAAGSMPLEDMLDYLKVYASTISMRWPPPLKPD